MNNISRLLSCFKALSRLDSILLAVATVATGIAGYSAYDSYIKTNEITALYSQVESFESRLVEMSSENSSHQSAAEEYRREARNARLQAASLGARVQDMERDAKDAAALIDGLVAHNRQLQNYVPDKSKPIRSSDQNALPVSLPQYTAPAAQYSFSGENVAREVRNDSRRAGIESEIYSVTSKIASLRASYNAAKGGLQSQYDSYSAQAQQAYINYMMLERDLGDTETEQHQIRLAKENQQQYANKAADVKEQIDRLTEQYNSDVAELEEYKAKLQKQLN